MKPLGRGLIIRRGVLASAALISVIAFTSFIMQNTFAQEGDTNDNSATESSSSSSEPDGFEYTTSIPDNTVHDRLLYPKRVTALFITEPYEGITYGTTVGEALEDLEIELSDTHYVKPPLDFILANDTHIRIQEIIHEFKTETHSVPFESVSVNDPTKQIYTTSVTQMGRNGETEVTLEHIYVNSILEDKIQVKEVETIKPLNEIIAVGTKKVEAQSVSECKEMGSGFWTDYIMHALSGTDEEKNWLLGVSACESGRRNCRIAGAGSYYGIMQYSISTFRGAGGSSIWSGEEQLGFALGAYRGGYAASSWPSCHSACTQ